MKKAKGVFKEVLKGVLIALALSVFFIYNFIKEGGAKNGKCFPVPCEKVKVVKKTSQDRELQTTFGEALDIGYLYREFGLLWVSIWNTNGSYVLVNKYDQVYYKISEEEATYLKEVHNFDVKEAGNPLSLIKKVGGKVLVVFLVLMILFDFTPFKN